MKLISLNTWGGKVFEPLMDFIKSHSRDTDIFCLQEVYDTQSDVKQHRNIRANLLDELKKALPGFRVFYNIEIRGFDSTPIPVNFDLSVGKAIFAKNNISINKEGELFLYGDLDEKFLKKDFSNLPVTMQYIGFTYNGKLFIVSNIHGTAFPGSKLDTKLRLKHSRKIKGFLKSRDGAKIITGDFNLLPQTESIKIFETEFKNLVHEFNIERTRSDLSPYVNRVDFQKFADYTFISSDVNAINFEVPVLEISDHLPMILEFN